MAFTFRNSPRWGNTLGQVSAENILDSHVSSVDFTRPSTMPEWTREKNIPESIESHARLDWVAGAKSWKGSVSHE